MTREEKAERQPGAVGRDDLGRCLVVCSILLLGAALLVRYHLGPAKHRLRLVGSEFRAVEAELDRQRDRNRDLRRELTALQRDPVYRERLKRRMFRMTSSPDELILKPHP